MLLLKNYRRSWRRYSESSRFSVLGNDSLRDLLVLNSQKDETRLPLPQLLVLRHYPRTSGPVPHRSIEIFSPIPHHNRETAGSTNTTFSKNLFIESLVVGRNKHREDILFAHIWYLYRQTKPVSLSPWSPRPTRSAGSASSTLCFRLFAAHAEFIASWRPSSLGISSTRIVVQCILDNTSPKLKMKFWNCIS